MSRLHDTSVIIREYAEEHGISGVPGTPLSNIVFVAYGIAECDTDPAYTEKTIWKLENSLIVLVDATMRDVDGEALPLLERVREVLVRA